MPDQNQNDQNQQNLTSTPPDPQPVGSPPDDQQQQPIVPLTIDPDIPSVPETGGFPIVEPDTPQVDDSIGSSAPSDIPPVTTPKKKFGGGKIIATILGFLVLVGGIAGGVILTQQQQNINEKAGGCCTSGNQCGSGVCDFAKSCPGGGGGVCGPCNSNSCKNGEECRGGQCVEKVEEGCGSNAECGAGQICDNHVCKPLTVACNDGVCSPEESTSTCPSDCPDTTPNSCAGITCPIGQQCTNGNCVAMTCLNSLDCPSGQTCTSGQCVPSSASGCLQLNCYDTLDHTYGAECKNNQYCYTEVKDRICSRPAGKTCNECGWSAASSAEDTIRPSGPKCIVDFIETKLCEDKICEGGTSPTAQCLNIKAYDLNDNNNMTTPMTAARLSALTTGSSVVFCVAGATTQGEFDNAKLVINGATKEWDPGYTYARRPGTKDFCIKYSIPAGTNTFNISGQIHHPTLGWK